MSNQAGIIFFMIQRDASAIVRRAAREFPVVAVTGPRQSGKSTLCRALFPDHAYASLEAPDTRQFATDDPRGFLSGFPDGAILDEIQNCPQLPSYLQGIVDADRRHGRWILTGSQHLAVMASVTQSLAGRCGIIHLLPLSYGEMVHFPKYPTTLDQVLLTGGYPRILDRQLNPSTWLSSYVATYIERDVRMISNIGDLSVFQKFVELCAGRTGQMVNLSSLAGDCGISQPTAKAWLSVLEASFITFRLPAFSTNVRKRLVKSPKLHFYDSGLVCWLLGIRNTDHLRDHPLRGAIFESWVTSEILKHRVHRGEGGKIYFYRDQGGVEADLVIDHADHLDLLEAKSGQTVAGDAFASLRKISAEFTDSRKCRTFLIYGGSSQQKRSNATVLPWNCVDDHNWT